MTANANQDICDMLMKLGEYERDINGLMYKYHAYRKASTSLATLTKRVESGNEAKKLPGIGPKIALKIDEYLNGDEEKDDKGKTSSESVVAKSKQSSSGKDLKLIDFYDKIIDLTKIDAMKMNIDGIVTIAQLSDKMDLLTEQQRVCLKYLEDLSQPIPRSEIKNFSKIFHSTLESANDRLVIKFVGEHRRKVKECSSIDVLITDCAITSSKTERLKETVQFVLQTLEKAKLITHKLFVDNEECVVLVKPSRYHRRLNIHFSLKRHHVCELIYHTGSDQFYEQVRQQSLNNGYLLDKNCLRKIGYTCVAGQEISLKQESDLFDYIDMPYVDPEHRNS